jgi:predicted transcriptional regulator of viral defense system
MSIDIQKLFEQSEGYLTRRQIPDKSSYNKLLKMIDEGVVVRVKPGIYSYGDIYSGTMIDVEKMVPCGVLCLFSTWLHYGLSTSIPHSFNIAIERGRKIKLPIFPPIQLYHWTKNQYELGITTQKIYDFNVKIYDIEKSVCDAVKFRNKIGIDVTAEVLKNYLRRQDRNLVKLSDYAKKMRIEKIMKTYLDMEL